MPTSLTATVLEKGTDRPDRTGTGTRSVFGYQMRFDLEEDFPLVTVKKTNWKAAAREILWFLSGSTNIGDLNATIWDEWADDNGDLGPIYGHQWRNWGGRHGEPGTGIDQITELLYNLRWFPDSRRHVISAWNPSDLPDDDLKPHENAAEGSMALAPCHTLFQFYVADGKLSCQLYQRSADVMIGVPFNYAGYALLIHLIAQAVGLKPGEFIHTLGDAHIYHNHFEAAETVLDREPRPLPKLHLNPEVTDLFAFGEDDIRVDGYDPHPAIKLQVAV